MGALNVVYRKREFNIYSADNNEFIVHNTKYPFSTHHTHLKRFSTCKFIINCAIQKTIPSHLSDYLLNSLIRLSDNEDYIGKLQYLLTIEKQERLGTSVKEKYNHYYNNRKRRYDKNGQKRHKH